MSEPRQILARWLDQPQPSEPPEGLDLAVVEAVYALRPDLAPAPRVNLDDVLDSVTEGPFAAPPQTDEHDARALANWLDDPDQPPVDDEVAEAVYALRPDLAPSPRVQLDDILDDVTEGPFAQAPTPIVDLAAERRRRGLWVGGATVAALAAATLLFVVPTADQTMHEASPFAAGQGAPVSSTATAAPTAAAPLPTAAPARLAHKEAEAPSSSPEVDAPAADLIHADKELPRAEEAGPLKRRPSRQDDMATLTKDLSGAATGGVEDSTISSSHADYGTAGGAEGIGATSGGAGRAVLGGLATPASPPEPGLAEREKKSKKRDQSDADKGANLDGLLEAPAEEALMGTRANSGDLAGYDYGDAVVLDDARPARSRPRKAAADRAASAPTDEADIDQLRSRAWPISPLPVLSDPEAAQAVAASNAAGSASKAISLLLPLLDSPNANVAMTAAFLSARRQYSLGAPDLALATIARGLSRGNGDQTLRARLLALQGEILEGRGDIDGATRLYRAAGALR